MLLLFLLLSALLEAKYLVNLEQEKRVHYVVFQVIHMNLSIVFNCLLLVCKPGLLV